MAKPDYNLNMDASFDFLQLVDLDKPQKAAKPSFNRTLVTVNDCAARHHAPHERTQGHSHTDG